jgi:hypothetical protein
MSDEDDAYIAGLLRQPAALNLMLLLVVGFGLVVVALIALSLAD